MAETIRLAAEAGLVGGSIEDSTGRADDPVRPLAEAVERVAAAVAAARELDFPFTVTARAENFFQGRSEPGGHHPPAAGVRGRGRRFLYAPGLPDAEAVRAVCAAVRPPGQRPDGFARPAVVRGGARRSSAYDGSASARRWPGRPFGSVVRAAEEIRTHGTFGFGADALPYPDLNRILDTGE